MKKVVIAIDSFKGSLTSLEAGHAIAEGIKKCHKDTEIIIKPLADGGEGTTEALIEGLHGEPVSKTVTGPLGEPVSALYGWLPDSKTAVMEMAAAAGIILVKRPNLNPLKATTYGVGELILDAIERGCKNIILGIGGSATNDGGIGMLKALGFEFFDADGKDVGEGAAALSRIASISSEKVRKELFQCKIEVACDVTNPLCGPNGATYIFGPQKGVTDELKQKIDNAMAHFALVSAEFLGEDHSKAKGAGAAGGLGFALLAYLHATLRSGIDLILDAVQLENALKDADVVVTGEGRLDHQTAMGKAPIGVAKLAKNYGATVIAFAGSVTEDAILCNENGIAAFFPIVRGIMTLDEAMRKETAEKNLTATAEQVFRLIP